MYSGAVNSYQNISFSQPPTNVIHDAEGFTSPSMTDSLLAPINELQALAQSLFQAVSSTQKATPAPPISAFLSIDASLASAVKQAREHQVKQRKIERMKDEVLELERRWRTIVQELEDGRRDLETILVEGEERLKGIEAPSFYPIPRTPCLRPKHFRVYVGTTTYARPRSTWATSTTTIFPTIPE